ncbi:hypothetical protein QBE52_12520 [Clostridiaceae bacterium 35-E11]
MPMYPSQPNVPPSPMPPYTPMPAPPYTPGTTPTPPYTPEPTPAPDYTTPPDFEYEPGAPVETDISYTQGYLRTQIGRYVKIEFLIGTNMLIDREGTLVDVGISYVIIREPETDDLVLCDIYAIKFVRIFF